MQLCEQMLSKSKCWYDVAIWTRGLSYVSRQGLGTVCCRFAVVQSTKVYGPGPCLYTAVIAQTPASVSVRAYTVLPPSAMFSLSAFAVARRCCCITFGSTLDAALNHVHARLFVGQALKASTQPSRRWAPLELHNLSWRFACLDEATQQFARAHCQLWMQACRMLEDESLVDVNALNTRTRRFYNHSTNIQPLLAFLRQPRKNRRGKHLIRLTQLTKQLPALLCAQPARGFLR